MPQKKTREQRAMESQQMGIWSFQEMKNHVSALELLAIKLSSHMFSKTLKHKAFHL